MKNIITIIGSVCLALALCSPIFYFLVNKDLGFVLLIPEIYFLAFYQYYLVSHIIGLESK